MSKEKEHARIIEWAYFSPETEAGRQLIRIYREALTEATKTHKAILKEIVGG